MHTTTIGYEKPATHAPHTHTGVCGAEGGKADPRKRMAEKSPFLLRGFLEITSERCGH